MSGDQAGGQGARGEGKPERMSDEERVLWSESIPGHRWDAVKRWCECGAEVGVVCDRQTVEEHLIEVSTPPTAPTTGGVS